MGDDRTRSIDGCNAGRIQPVSSRKRTRKMQATSLPELVTMSGPLEIELKMRRV
jgi:hypothetical protein